MNGKGDKRRKTDEVKYRSNWEKIFRKKRNKKAIQKIDKLTDNNK